MKHSLLSFSIFTKRAGLLASAMIALTATAAAEDIEVAISNGATRQPVAGIMVTLENAGIGFRATTATNEQGKVRFSGLTTSGAYSVSTDDSEEYLPGRVTNITLRANAPRSINLVLIPKRTTESRTITVIGKGEAELNSINAEVSSTISTRQIEGLPVEGRDLTRVLFRLPNVTQATGFFTEAPNVSINGVNGLYANYLVDGMDNNENFLGGQKFAMPSGFAQSVTVLANNYSTEFGRTGSGIFNITTRSGSNTMSGEVFYLVRPGPSIDAGNPYAQRDLSGNQVKDGFQRHQAGVAVGGAIVPDKTFFYANFEQTFDLKDNLLSVPQLNVSQTVRGTNNFSFASFKINHFWSERFSSSLRANVGLVGIERQGGGLEGGIGFPSSANTQDRNSVLIGSQNIYTGENFTYEGNLQFSRFRWNYANPANPTSPQVFVLDSSGNNALAVLGHPGYVFDDVENTINVQQKISMNMGNHRLKFGAELLSADFALTGGGNPNGNYTVRLNGQQQRDLAARQLGSGFGINDIPSDVAVLNYSIELQPTSFGKRQNIISVYAEDLFSVSSNLNLTIGLRYDYDNLSVGGGDAGDLDNIAPRLSFNYKLDEQSVIRGGYGIFYDKILYAIYSDALQQNSTSAGYRQQLQQLIDRGLLPADTDLDNITNDGNVTADVANGVTYLQGPSSESQQNARALATSNERRILNPNGYQNPMTHQVSLGYQYQASDNTLFYADLMYTQSRNLPRLYNLNAPALYPINAQNVVVRTDSAADATRPIAVIPGGAKNIVMTEMGGKGEYMAASLNVVKEKGGDDYAYRLSYTLSRSYNNTEDINFKAQDGNNFQAEWGPSVNDRTHVVSGIFYYYPIADLGVTVAALLQSGQPINRVADGTKFGTTDLNGDGTSYGDQYVANVDRTPGVERNADRLPWSKTVDLGIQYSIPVSSAMKVEVRADIFNAFNIVNLSGYANNATQSNQIQVGNVGDPVVQRNIAPLRQFQFGARLLF